MAPDYIRDPHKCKPTRALRSASEKNLIIPKKDFLPMATELSVPLHQSCGTVYHSNLKMLIHMMTLKITLKTFLFRKAYGL